MWLLNTQEIQKVWAKMLPLLTYFVLVISFMFTDVKHEKHAKVNKSRVVHLYSCDGSAQIRYRCETATVWAFSSYRGLEATQFASGSCSMRKSISSQFDSDAEKTTLLILWMKILWLKVRAPPTQTYHFEQLRSSSSGPLSNGYHLVLSGLLVCNVQSCFSQPNWDEWSLICFVYWAWVGNVHLK